VWVPAAGDSYRSIVLDAAARADVSPPDEATIREADRDSGDGWGRLADELAELRRGERA
jgi:hypothetical protein